MMNLLVQNSGAFMTPEDRFLGIPERPTQHCFRCLRSDSDLIGLQLSSTLLELCDKAIFRSLKSLPWSPFSFKCGICRNCAIRGFHDMCFMVLFLFRDDGDA